MNMSQYSRSNKNQKPEDTTDSRPSRGEKVKQGLSVFQTVVATIASLLIVFIEQAHNGKGSDDNP